MAELSCPANSQQLAQDAQQLPAMPIPHDATPKAMIAPPTKYIYSAAIAATVYATLHAVASHIKDVILLNPTHRAAVRRWWFVLHRLLQGRFISGQRTLSYHGIPSVNGVKLAFMRNIKMDEGIDLAEQYPAKYWHHLDDGRIQCDLCPRDCKLHDGQRGACFVRGRVGGSMILSTYGRSSGFCVDPIEKKPLNQFYPGSSVLSFGTAGCNLACKFCQNWDISKSRSFDTLAVQASPDEIALRARQLGCKSVAFTYNDPVIFAEYAMDTADACHAHGIKTVAVTAGYIHAAPRRDFFAKMDAANVDLKAFTDEFYIKQTGSHLQPVLDTLRYLKHETAVWFELTTLLIPGLNDSAREITKMSAWIAKELGVDVPLHFSAFHPDHKMTSIPVTPKETLIKARQIALDAGLQYVYTGNVHNSDGDTTYCPSCDDSLIVRDWYEIKQYRLTANDHCPGCNTKIAGRFEKFEGRL